MQNWIGPQNTNDYINEYSRCSRATLIDSIRGDSSYRRRSLSLLQFRYTIYNFLKLGALTMFTAWSQLSPRILHEYLEHKCLTLISTQQRTGVIGNRTRNVELKKVTHYDCTNMVIILSHLDTYNINYLNIRFKE